MLTHGQVLEHLEAARTNLEGWQEPGGFLVPTEPDEDERWIGRVQLEAAIAIYERVLEVGGEGQVSRAARRMGMLESKTPVHDRAIALLREWVNDGHEPTPCNRTPPCTMCRTREFLANVDAAHPTPARQPDSGRCSSCPHTPHLGTCNGRNGQSANPCPCLRSSFGEPRECLCPETKRGTADQKWAHRKGSCLQEDLIVKDEDDHG